MAQTRCLRQSRRHRCQSEASYFPPRRRRQHWRFRYFQDIADKPTGFNGLIADFAEAIQQGREPLNSAEQAYHLMQMLDALRESANR